MEQRQEERDTIVLTPPAGEEVSPAAEKNADVSSEFEQNGTERADAEGQEAPSRANSCSEESKEDEGEIDLRYRSGKEVAKGGVLGFFIGLAVIVPGVSGSTVAIIFRLYRKLLYALGNLFRRFRRCAAFLLPVLLGLAVGFVLGFFAVQQLIDLSPFAVVGLFAGLMLGSFPAVFDEVRREKKTPLRLGLFAVGVAIPVAIALLSVFAAGGSRSLEGLHAGHYLLFVLLGALMAVTQLVPGLSATALMMAFGYFKPVMESVSLTYWRQNPAVFGVYSCLAVGFVIGLLGCSKLLTVLLSRCRAAAFFAIVGLSLGSLLTMFFNPEIYSVYESWAGALDVVDLSLGIALFAAGVALAYVFVRYERKKGGAQKR